MSNSVYVTVIGREDTASLQGYHPAHTAATFLDHP